MFPEPQKKTQMEQKCLFAAHSICMKSELFKSTDWPLWLNHLLHLRSFYLVKYPSHPPPPPVTTRSILVKTRHEDLQHLQPSLLIKSRRTQGCCQCHSTQQKLRPPRLLLCKVNTSTYQQGAATLLYLSACSPAKASGATLLF